MVRGKHLQNGFPVASPLLPMLLLLHQSSRNGLTVVSASELDRLIPIIFNHIFKVLFMKAKKTFVFMKWSEINCKMYKHFQIS